MLLPCSRFHSCYFSLHKTDGSAPFHLSSARLGRGSFLRDRGMMGREHPSAMG